MVLDAGSTPVGVESTVVDLSVSPPVIRRPGGVTLEMLREVMPDVVAGSHDAERRRRSARRVNSFATTHRARSSRCMSAR